MRGKSNLLKQSSLRCTAGTKNRVNALSSIIPDIKTNEEMLNLILDKFEENLSTDEKTELRLVLNVLNRKPKKSMLAFQYACMLFLGFCLRVRVAKGVLILLTIF